MSISSYTILINKIKNYDSLTNINESSSINNDNNDNNDNNIMINYIKKHYKCKEMIEKLILNGFNSIKILKNNIIYEIEIFDYEITFTSNKNNTYNNYTYINDLINENINEDCIVLSYNK